MDDGIFSFAIFNCTQIECLLSPFIRPVRYTLLFYHIADKHINAKYSELRKFLHLVHNALLASLAKLETW
jgi:hypothetical protein